MEVNIVEQLFPNGLTVLTQLCSTLILFLIAKYFLWASVKSFLDARAEKMQEELALSQKAKEEALADRKVALEQLNTASTKSEEIVSAAIQQAKQEKKQILAQADKEAAAVKQRAQEQIEAERREMYASMKKEMVDVAFSAAGKLIGEQEAEKVDRQAIDAFVKETVGNGE
ncbi:ATP synthase F0 subunit B [Solobacterium sp.]|uniref:ATP synthase F0 subunit B n=1 Tax=Solobacterium sp. TaxID=2060878 RepID=UPI001CAB3A72|nr:ATP synthase F0 subunit B [Solobacterium sp.]MBF1095187.1 ATP synthase F0 subunit B [Solobacterium sp.]MBF1099279.1 ATP synthase F0 subunit B [Solobacterium sp.]